MSLITLFDPWRSNLCTCPLKYSLSAYTGCGHKCRYCYASSYIRNFYTPREKKDFLKRLKKELKTLPKNALITMANSSDPYLPLEEKYGLTRAALNLLKCYQPRLTLVTKSSLILRDLDILKEMKKRVVISFTITTLNNESAKKLEPLAPPSSQRLEAIEKLSKYFPVVCRLDPLIYPVNTPEIKKIIKEVKQRGVKQIIASTYKAKPDNFKRMCNTFEEYKKLWRELYLEKGERIKGYFYLPVELRKKLIEEVREVSLKEGLEFSSCREGFSNLNTKACDGSSFF